ncbi:MAG: hypothetical protein QOG62_523 [Thermoleophilaceae bacterium]|jgi:hypothetical protein|nr:hypothetical protein [Thermoleophilaceae bacterium]
MTRPIDTRAIEVEGMSRGAFLLRGALTTAAVSGLAAVQPFVASALGSGKFKITGGPGAKVDLDIANFALTLEELEAAFYAQALDQVSLSASTRELAQLIGDNESQHVEKLKSVIEVLGGKPGKTPKFNFPLSDEASFLELAEALEDTGVGAYNGAAPQIISSPLLEAAGGIVQVEGRHSGAIKMARGMSPSEAFSQALDIDEVLARTKKYIDSPQ